MQIVIFEIFEIFEILSRLQFCANDPETFASACELAEPHCDGVDLNLGCPQVIAARGIFFLKEISHYVILYCLIFYFGTVLLTLV